MYERKKIDTVVKSSCSGMVSGKTSTDSATAIIMNGQKIAFTLILINSARQYVIGNLPLEY